MCGIVCRHSHALLGRENDGFLAGAMKAIGHRGPDGSGAWRSGPVELGHVRLAIISPADGQQPLVEEASGVAMTYNGEIYNYREIRRDLEAKGHAFKTRCDTEVLLRGYMEYGPDVVQKLNGIFGFVIYDAKKRLLFGARDHLGVKPLYYYKDKDRFLCASEVKALLCDPAVKPVLRQDRLFEHLVFGFVAGADTLYKGIQQLEPGQIFLFREGELTLKSFWDPKERRPLLADEQKAAGELEEELRRAVRLQLVSDAPLGCLLSGGVDSSTLVCFVNRERTGVPAFTLRHLTEGYDETPYAKTVSEANGVPLNIIDIDSADALELLPKVIWFYDEPVIQTNTIGLYKLCERISSHGIKVLLSGEGADESFGGYERYAESLGLYQNGKKDVVMYGRNEVAFPRIERFWPGRPRRFEYRERLAERLASFERGNQILIYDQRTYLPHLLQRQDRMGMAHGIEVRVPFLDYRLVDWANGLSPDLKIRKDDSKFILKKLGERYLPADFLRRRKMAFDTPVEKSLAGGEFNAFFKDAIGPRAAVSAFFDVKGIEGLMKEFEQGRRELWRILWQILCVEVWMKTFKVEAA